MIICIGEILADLIGEGENLKMFIGGAPFNVAVNAKQAGAKVGFVGKVGKDPVGNFLKAEANKFGFDSLTVQTDAVRNTTLAFVTLNNGERDFAFFRHDTADYNIDISDVSISDYNIVHLGSLMLSEKNGVKFAKKIVKMAKKQGKLLSFDVNFRMDLYNELEDAIKAYKPFVSSADILKFSDDEILDYTGKDNLEDAINAVYKKGTLLLITMGSKGSMYVYNDNKGLVASAKKVTPIDTTGAGDAFFGTLLANLDGVEFTVENIEKAMVKANEKGAETTLFKGAVKL
ncbi:MAG: carbohydrate kinase [Clostridia bacterium]|nr:carbohydrate kinase [Clostridia bacterium]